MDCSTDSGALALALSEAATYRSAELNFVGSCLLSGRTFWASTGSRLRLIGSGKDSSKIFTEDGIIVARGASLEIFSATVSPSDANESALALVATRNTYLRLVDITSAGSISINKNSSLVANGLYIDGYLSVRENSSSSLNVATFGALTLGTNSSVGIVDVFIKGASRVYQNSTIVGAGDNTLGGDREPGGALNMGSSSVFNQPSGSLLVAGTVDLQEGSSLIIGQLTSLVFEDTVYMGSSSFESYTDNTIMRKKSDDLGRALAVGNSSSAHFWGSLTMQGFGEGDQNLRVDESSSLMIRGRDGIRSVLGNLGISGGSSVYVRDASIETMGVQGTVDFDAVTLNGPSYLQKGGVARFNDLSFGPNGQLQIDSGAVSVSGAVPPLSAFNCAGPSTLDVAGYTLSPDSGINCLDGSGWYRLIRDSHAP